MRRIQSVRSGLGSGKGSGYKNIIAPDSSIHSQSAKGISQPQKVSPVFFRPPQTNFTNYTIGTAFFEGATRGKSLNMSIVDTPKETLLVGYGWAVYGAKDKETGKVTYYSGWRGYSSTTSKQLSQTGIMVKADKTEATARRLSDSI